MNSIYVTRATLPEYEDYINEIKSIWSNHWLTNMGEKHNLLQREISKYLGVERIELLTNGHNALELVLQALDLKGEVITTPFTFVSTISSIIRCGLTPVFCDINPDDYTIDVDLIENLITERTCAILPVHVYGNVCDVESIEKIADKHNLKVIYDAAHAFGVRYKDRSIASFGDAACFSFHATKVFNTIEGGAVCSEDKALLDQICLLRDFGISDSDDDITYPGTNAKMHEFSAAMGLCNLKSLDNNIRKRKKIIDRYYEKLSGIEGIKTISPNPSVISNYSYMPIFVQKEIYGRSRDDLSDLLAEKKIFARKYFYPTINNMTFCKKRFDHGITPIADLAGEQVLTLPLYPELEISIVDEICNTIIDNINGR